MSSRLTGNAFGHPPFCSSPIFSSRIQVQSWVVLQFAPVRPFARRRVDNLGYHQKQGEIREIRTLARPGRENGEEEKEEAYE